MIPDSDRRRMAGISLLRNRAGASVTEAALTNARELKKFAEQYKKGALDE